MQGTGSPGTRNPIGRAFRILAWMAAREDGPFGLREIAKGVEMNPSTVHRLLGLLEEEGLVRQDDHGGAYGLGTELLRLARIASGTHPARVAALPAMRDLAAASGETVTFGVYDPVRGQTSVVAVVGATLRFATSPSSTNGATSTPARAAGR